MRGLGYTLVADLLVAAGHTREQASAAIARIEWDVLDAVRCTVSSIGVRFPDDRDEDGYVDGWHEQQHRGQRLAWPSSPSAPVSRPSAAASPSRPHRTRRSPSLCHRPASNCVTRTA
ncbi:hypothetical protein [Kitasatospora sp. SolWspMP-SS2h]|uniref:hypothetical protein n=1 Tax=Kitasatospora sp. SolWspMP-SS2h TaxID=1305729 RepID=UPI001F453777|nr:hypothetical protein [Kitasatospora sp. SolWspMP-SS2h]